MKRDATTMQIRVIKYFVLAALLLFVKIAWDLSSLPRLVGSDLFVSQSPDGKYLSILAYPSANESNHQYAWGLLLSAEEGDLLALKEFDEDDTLDGPGVWLCQEGGVFGVPGAPCTARYFGYEQSGLSLPPSMWVRSFSSLASLKMDFDVTQLKPARIKCLDEPAQSSPSLYRTLCQS